MTAEQVNALIKQAGYDKLTVPYGVRNFRLRYVTQDRGKAVEATAAVGVPVGTAPGEARPIAIVLHGWEGASDECAPTRDPMSSTAGTTLFASLGFVTVFPDYIGMVAFGAPSPPGTLHPYLVGEPTAIASLDAARAALAAIEAESGAAGEGAAGGGPWPGVGPGLTRGARDRVVLFGGSQGGHAVFFVDRYAPHYAPEFKLVAAVAAVPPTDMTGLATWGLANFGLPGKTLAGALVSLWTWYGKTANGKAVDLADALTDQPPLMLASTFPATMATDCRSPRVLEDTASPAEIYAAGFLAKGAAGDWDSLDPWGCWLAENSVATTSVPRANDTPYFVQFGEADDLVITSVERTDVARLCDAGYRIRYLECAGKGHTDGGLPSFPRELAWLNARLAGEPLPAADVCAIGAPTDCDAM
ncbi:MAG: hypothetical protein FJ087_02375 [Deltaproteobacteria bacterium]|nr:hypothetical protein [Deltaproteobacteria bacterium]